MASNYPAALDTTGTFPTQATLAAHGLNTDPHSKLHGDIGAAILQMQSYMGTTAVGTYTPAWQGANITSHSATWSGKYLRMGQLGFVSIKGAITGTWSGSSAGYIELGLPSGWTTVSGWSNNGLMGCGTAFANHANQAYGLHYPMTPVMHDGITGVRFISPTKKTVSSNDLQSFVELACDGVASGPFDVAMVSGDEFWAAITVLLA